MKLRSLLEKFTFGWLGQIKSSIKLILSDRPITYTFAQAVQTFKTDVNIKYPPVEVPTRIEQEMVKGRGRGKYGGMYSGRYSGRGRGSGIFGHYRGLGYIPKLGSKFIALVNGKKIDYHASIKFSGDIYHQMTNNQQENIHRERK